MRGIVSLEFVLTYLFSLIILVSAFGAVLATDTLGMTEAGVTSCTIYTWLSCDDARLEQDIVSMNISSRTDFPLHIENVSLYRNNQTAPCIANFTLREEDEAELICGAKPFLNSSFSGIPQAVDIEINAYNLHADESYTRSLDGQIQLIG